MLSQQNKEIAARRGVQVDKEITLLQNRLQQQTELKNKADTKCEKLISEKASTRSQLEQAVIHQEKKTTETWQAKLNALEEEHR